MNKYNLSRRNFLIGATCVTGSLTFGLVMIPFVGSWLPSAQAMAIGGPIDVDIRSVSPGKKITVAWRGKPVFIVNRSNELLEKLQTITNKLRDPESLVSNQPAYTKNIYRALNKNIFVVVGVCTHLGCVPVYHPLVGELEPTWVGGFYCPCHGSKFDLSGRVFKGVPAPVNLSIPPYRFIDTYTLRIGEDHKI